MTTGAVVKKGTKLVVNNFRPIPYLAIYGKISGKVIFLLEENDIIASCVVWFHIFRFR